MTFLLTSYIALGVTFLLIIDMLFISVILLKGVPPYGFKNRLPSLLWY
jgi:hypothetical protein